MKRFLLWLVGVVLGVGIFLGAVMGVSYAFTTEGGCPDSTAQAVRMPAAEQAARPSRKLRREILAFFIRRSSYWVSSPFHRRR